MRDLHRNDIAEMLAALGELLGARGLRYELVLIGGASLQLRGVISRPTRDADVLAERVNDRVVAMPSLPDDLRAAVRDVGEAYGAAIWLAGRYDLVCFKLYAAADEWPTRGRHLQDLAALAPRAAELGHAARWVRSHDPSAGFRDRQLTPLLRDLGVQVDVGD